MATAELVPTADRMAYRFSEIAPKRIPISTKTLRRMAEAGELKTVRLRGVVLIPASEVARLEAMFDVSGV